MKILIDECLSATLRKQLLGHEAWTVSDKGWAGIANGKLLARAAESFDVFLTIDQSLSHQQDLTKLPLAIIVVQSITNTLDDLLPLIPMVLEAITNIKPGQIVRIGR